MPCLPLFVYLVICLRLSCLLKSLHFLCLSFFFFRTVSAERANSSLNIAGKKKKSINEILSHSKNKRLVNPFIFWGQLSDPPNMVTIPIDDIIVKLAYSKQDTFHFFSISKHSRKYLNKHHFLYVFAKINIIWIFRNINNIFFLLFFLFQNNFFLLHLLFHSLNKMSLRGFYMKY